MRTTGYGTNEIGKVIMENNDQKTEEIPDPNIFQICWSILAAFIGVQSKKNLDRDNAYIEKKGLKPYIIIGIILTILFYVTIYSIVKLVVP